MSGETEYGGELEASLLDWGTRLPDPQFNDEQLESLYQSSLSTCELGFEKVGGQYLFTHWCISIFLCIIIIYVRELIADMYYFVFP